MRSIVQCRTAALGGHLEECDHCGNQRNAYNSCRNRNCPKCQSSAAKRWLQQQETELLPVPYFHVVFTVPQEIARIALGNQKVVYGILFRCVSQTLLQIAEDRKHLGCQIGFLAILHTWGQNLDYHPHIHCVIPGGGLQHNGGWLQTRKQFFLQPCIPKRRIVFCWKALLAFFKKHIRFFPQRGGKKELARLLQTSIWRRPPAGASVSGTLHSPDRNF